MKKISLISILILSASVLSCLPVFSSDPENMANGVISGKVLDASTNQPMEYVNIAVYNLGDSSLVTGTITDPAGNFKISKLPEGKYLIKMTFIGFEKKDLVCEIKNPRDARELGEILLSSSSEKIDEVEIVGERQRVEYKLDKRVINVEKDLSAKGGTAASVLANSPSVQTDQQGNILLRGSSDFLVLIDGKPSVMKGSDALKQIPSGSIKQIELITNPSARYDADGQAGIINIIQKKEKLQGLSGSLNTGIGTLDKSTSNLLVNARKNKVNVFAGFDLVDNTYHQSIIVNNSIFRESGNVLLNEDITGKFRQSNTTGKTGFDYEVNEKNQFSISGSYGIQGYDNSTYAKYYRGVEGSPASGFNISDNVMDVDGKVVQVNADYTHKFSDNHSLTFSNQYYSWEGLDDNLLTVYRSNSDFLEQSVDYRNNYLRENYNYQVRNNLDYSRPLGKGKLEAGYQFRYEKRDNELVYRNQAGSENSWTINENLSYIQNYLNSINSGYVSYSNQILGAEYQLGLRTEYFKRDIAITNENQDFNFEKFMLYPSAHISKSLKEIHQVQFSYSRRINRPEPYLLHNTPNYIDPFNILMGNPDLQPEYTDAFEANYRLGLKKLSLSVQTYYRKTSNCITPVRIQSEDGIMQHKLSNADFQTAMGAETGIELKLFSWWQFSNNLNLYRYSIQSGYNGMGDKREVFSWDYRMMSNFLLKKGTRLQLNSYYRAEGIDAMGTASGFSIFNFSASQSLMKNRLTLTLSLQDLLSSNIFIYRVETPEYSNSYKINSEGFSAMINLSYSFNNFQYKQRGRRDDASFKGGGGF